jgi:hypothetical protein
VSGSIAQMLASQKAMFNDCKDLSQVIFRIYQSNSQDTTWPPSQNAYSLGCGGAAEQYKQAWESIHDCVRSSVGNVCMTEAYDPLKDTSAQMSKSVDEEIKTRKACLTDFDSYRRRLKGLQQKRDKNEVSTVTYKICIQLFILLLFGYYYIYNRHKAKETLQLMQIHWLKLCVLNQKFRLLEKIIIQKTRKQSWISLMPKKSTMSCLIQPSYH